MKCLLKEVGTGQTLGGGLPQHRLLALGAVHGAKDDSAQAGVEQASAVPAEVGKRPFVRGPTHH